MQKFNRRTLNKQIKQSSNMFMKYSKNIVLFTLFKSAGCIRQYSLKNCVKQL